MHAIKNYLLTQKRLQVFKKQFDNQFETVKIIGNDIGAFIHIKHQNRAIELSELRNGKIWIEFWKDHKDCAVAEITLKKYDDASKILKDWLIKRSDLKEYLFIEWNKE